MNSYGLNIIANESNEKIANDILQALDNEDCIELDFTGIRVMTTYAAKRILRPIVEKYGFSELFKKLSFHNVSSEIKVVISAAIDGLKG